MNKIFKVVWNRTIQSFVVTSELAKGRVKSSAEQNSTDVSAESGKNGIATVFRLTVISAALFGASNAYAATAPQGQIATDGSGAIAISGATATGFGALGVGLAAQANQGNAIAIGNSAQAQTGNTIAIGKSAVANSPASGSAPSSAIALGADANATGLGTIAIGRASEVLSQNSMNVNSTHNNIAIGNTARVGDSSSSKITQSIAIGSGNRVDPQGRPEGAWAKGDQSIAVGGNVLANGNSSVAIGGDDLDAVGGTRYSGNATDKFINYNEKGAKTGEYTLSGKSLRDIYKEMTGDTMNYGSYGNTIAGQGSVALGVQSNSSADLSLAIGTKSQATAFGGVALGTGAKATLLNSVALGTASKTDKEGKAYVQREIMGVTYTWAGGQTTDAGDVVSVGSKGYERQIINVSPGDISATSTDAINGSQLYGVLSAIERVRYFSVNSTDGSTDGTKNWNNDGAKGANSIAIGPSASTTSAATNGVAIGNQANVTGVNAVALGNGTTASVQDSVALGNGAVGAANNFDATAKNASFKNDSGAATNVSYAASSSSTTGAVSVGSAGNERQIQNVAAGRISATSTDAVNGSQLYTVMNNVGHNIQQNGTDKSRINNNGTVNYADGNLTTVAVTDGENASKVQINVTQGSLSVDNNGTVSAPTAGVATAGDVANAINNAKTTTKVEAGSNTHVNKTTSGKETTYTVSADKATVQVSNALNLTSNTTTAADGAVTTDYSIDLAQNTKDDIQKGVDAKTTVDTKGLTFNGDSGSTNIEKLGSTVTVAGDDNITTEAQDDKVTVKLKKDLVVDSVKAGDTTVNNDGVKVGDDVALTQDGVKAGDVKLTKNGLNNAGNKVTNVADGDLNANSKDAVNGSQLFATNQNVANNAANIAKGINFGGTTGSNNYALGDTINVKGDSNIISETVAGGAQLKLAKDITVDSVTAGDSKLNTDGLTITGGPSVTKSGINAAGNKITNVAPGTDDTDAVNYSQLKQQSAAARTEVAAGTNIKDVVKTTGANGQDIYTVNAKGTTASAGSDKLTVTAAAADANNVTDYSIDLADGTKTDIQKGVDAKTTVDTKGLTFNGDSGSTNIEKLGSTVTVAGDDNITTEAQDDKVTVKLKKDLVVDSVKAGDTTVNNDGVKVGDDVALTQDGVKAGDVKLTKNGLNNAGNKVTNVAAGTDDTDAVNYGQLKETNANVAKGLNIAADNGSDDNVQLGETVAYRSSDKNIVTTVSDNQIDFKLAKDITVDSVTAGDSKLNTDGLTITGGPSVTKAGINAAGNKITNVAPGTDDADAVNYSQLKQQSAAARTEVAAGTNIKDVVKTTGANGQDVYTVNAKGTTASAGSSKVTVTAAAEDTNNVTNYSIDLAQDTKTDIQKGVDAKTTVDSKGLTFNGDSGSTNVEKLGSTVTVAGDDNITTAAQDDKVTVKLNKKLVVDSVKAGDTTVNNDGVTVAGGPSLTKSGIDAAGNKVTNVADGDLNANSKDAVNGSQLFATNQNVANNAANIAKGINFGGTTGSNNYALGDTINVKGDSNIISETVAGGAQLKLAKDITVDSVTAGDSKLNTDGLTITGGPSVTKSGINAAGNKITNVAPGTDDADAVNYSQLKQQSAAARTEVAAGTNIKDVVKTTGANGQDIYTVNAKGTTASAGSDKLTVTAAAADANNVTDYSIDLADGTKTDIQKGVDAKTTVDTKGLTFNGDSGSTNIEKLGSTVTVAGDDNITTEAQDDKVTVKLKKDLVVDSV
ncbi:ESPR-type extended signal peptide-containing protein, partial [Neisseria subflava]|uniref:ESPR-type extended signal peptide-containing protein n=1 Tax=Neisseria subflava TaxID=28449 RepID=UPI003F88D380